MANVSPELVTGFNAVADPAAQVLILGSMPGVASLQQQAYYAHPRNAFWPIMQALFDVPVSMAYEQRLQRLKDNRIALWDVAFRCQRKGSLDADIRMDSVQVNDFKGLFKMCPDIKVICFNGGKAAQMFKTLVQKPQPEHYSSLEFLALPSTSPANARYNLLQKTDQWSQIKAYLLDL